MSTVTTIMEPILYTNYGSNGKCSNNDTKNRYITRNSFSDLDRIIANFSANTDYVWFKPTLMRSWR